MAAAPPETAPKSDARPGKRLKLDAPGARPCGRAAHMSVLPTSLVAIIYSHLNLTDHVALSLAGRALNTASRLRASSPADFLHHFLSAPPSRIPAWLQPCVLTFAFGFGMRKEVAAFSALRDRMGSSLTSLDIQQRNKWPRREAALAIEPACLDLRACTRLVSLTFGFIQLPGGAVLGEMLACMPHLAHLSIGSLRWGQVCVTLESLPTTLVSLRLPPRDDRYLEIDASALGRLTRLESLDFRDDLPVSPGVADRLLNVLSPTIQHLQLGTLEAADYAFVLPASLVEFECGLNPRHSRFEFPSSLRRLGVKFSTEINIGGSRASQASCVEQWVAAVPAHVERLSVGYSDIDHRCVAELRGSFLDSDHVLLPISCAASLVSLTVGNADRLHRSGSDAGCSRAVCDGFAAAFPSLTHLALSGSMPTVQGSISIETVLGLAALPRLVSLDLGEIGGLGTIETYNMRLPPARCYADYAASADCPSGCLAQQIVERYPLLTHLTLPHIDLLPSVHDGPCPPGCDCRIMMRARPIHAAFHLAHMAKSFARLVHLRHLDVRGLGVLPSCVVLEWARRPPPQLSRLRVVQPWARPGESAGAARLETLEALRWRGIELVLAEQSGYDDLIEDAWRVLEATLPDLDP